MQIPRTTFRALLAAVLLLGSACLAPGVETREQALKNALRSMRDAIDQHFGDTGHSPETLEDLVHRGYLPAVPTDPLTGRADTWALQWEDEGVCDVRSGSHERAKDGTRYATW